MPRVACVGLTCHVVSSLTEEELGGVGDVVEGVGPEDGRLDLLLVVGVLM